MSRTPALLDVPVTTEDKPAQPSPADSTTTLTEEPTRGHGGGGDGWNPAYLQDHKEPDAAAAERYLSPAVLHAFRRGSSDTFSIASVEPLSNAQGERPITHFVIPDDRYLSNGPVFGSTAWVQRVRAFWWRNRGLFYVVLSQFFGSSMNVITGLLERDEGDKKGMKPFQILFVRMGLTSLFCMLFMWYKKVPNFLLGEREVRLLLVARGLAGFFGIYSMYYALLYLPLSEATVITFLGPMVACWLCSFVIKEQFTRLEQLACFISFLGVVVIARPASLFAHDASPGPIGSGTGDATPTYGNSTHPASPGSHDVNAVSAAERLGAVGMSLVGVAGSAVAYTTIRWIGKRAHPLISVNYFAVYCTLVSVLACTFAPSVGWQLPQGGRQWVYLLSLGTCGFAMQFLMTAGLQLERSSRAANMIYTQMLFALGFDKLVWGITPGVWSILGSSLILGSAIWVAVHRTSEQESKREAMVVVEDEETGLVDGMDANTDDVEAEEEVALPVAQTRQSLGDVQEMQTLR